MMNLNPYKLSKNHGYSSEIASVESKFRSNRILYAKLGQLPWTYLWIVDIFALSYQRALSVGSTLKKTMQKMHLEGCLPHVVSLFVNRTGRITGGYRCGCSIAAADWLTLLWPIKKCVISYFKTTPFKWPDPLGCHFSVFYPVFLLQ